MLRNIYHFLNSTRTLTINQRNIIYYETLWAKLRSIYQRKGVDTSPGYNICPKGSEQHNKDKLRRPGKKTMRQAGKAACRDVS